LRNSAYGNIIDSIRSDFNGTGNNHEYGYDSGLSNHDFIDLYRFSFFVASSSSLPASLRNAAHDVMNAISDAVISRHTQNDYSNDSYGISIYYPKDPDHYNQTPYGGNYDNLPTSRNTHWDEFIKHEGVGNGSDYTLTTTAYNWINTPHTTFITEDDQSVRIDLPFTFTFYGQQYNSVFVCSNGFLSFTSRSTLYNPQQIPSPANPNAVVAPLWRDLNPRDGGEINYYAGSDEFVVTYDNVVNNRNNSPQTFQVIPYPNGEIVFQYKDITNDSTTTIGLENESGTKGRTAPFPSNGTAYRWIPTSKSINSTMINTILSLKHMSIYNGKLHLEFSRKPTYPVDVSIYNIMGQRFYKGTFKPEREISLNVNHLKTGIYVVFVKTGALKESEKVILTK